ncbi:MAG: MurR/RpiR family transcriptional regulator [Burkholderiales bacterium]|nr:MurR/RpiR family transcriptional regulator [Burkholderiales bacterium]
MSIVDFESLKSEITKQYPGLSRQLQDIARFTLDSPQEMALDTVATAAAKAGVQPSAMVRFAQALGFGGFSEMQQIFRDQLVQRSSSYRDRIERLRQEHAKDSPSAVLREFVNESIANLNHLGDHITVKTLEDAINVIAGADRIHVLAQRRAFPVACYLTYALSQMELPVSLMDGVGGMVRDQALGIREGDVLIAVSFRNYSPDVIALAAECKKRGVAVIVITDSTVSPLQRYATVAFDLGDHGDQPFRSLVEPMCLAQSLVVSIGYHLAKTSAKKPVSAARKVASKVPPKSASKRRSS